MYERDGERYYIVDGHVHHWNAAPDNWVEGQEVYAKGFIDCFYAYHGLGPAECHWPYEQFQQYDAEVMMDHLFVEGYVDVAIFQPTTCRSGTEKVSTPRSATRSSPSSTPTASC